MTRVAGRWLTPRRRKNVELAITLTACAATIAVCVAAIVALARIAL